jgi:hypothetical protein
MGLEEPISYIPTPRISRLRKSHSRLALFASESLLSKVNSLPFIVTFRASYYPLDRQPNVSVVRGPLESLVLLAYMQFALLIALCTGILRFGGLLGLIWLDLPKRARWVASSSIDALALSWFVASCDSAFSGKRSLKASKLLACCMLKFSVVQAPNHIRPSRPPNLKNSRAKGYYEGPGQKL